YGARGSVDAPLAGHSLQRQADGALAEKNSPDPTNWAGATMAGLRCACPTSYFRFCGPAIPSTDPVASQDGVCNSSGAGGSASYDLPNGLAYAAGHGGPCEYGGNGSVSTHDTYFVVGPRAGTAVTFLASCDVLLSANAGEYCYYRAAQAGASLSI